MQIGVSMSLSLFLFLSLFNARSFDVRHSPLVKFSPTRVAVKISHLEDSSSDIYTVLASFWRECWFKHR